MFQSLAASVVLTGIGQDGFKFVIPTGFSKLACLVLDGLITSDILMKNVFTAEPIEADGTLLAYSNNWWNFSSNQRIGYRRTGIISTVFQAIWKANK